MHLNSYSLFLSLSLSLSLYLFLSVYIYIYIYACEHEYVCVRPLVRQPNRFYLIKQTSESYLTDCNINIYFILSIIGKARKKSYCCHVSDLQVSMEIVYLYLFFIFVDLFTGAKEMGNSLHLKYLRSINNHILVRKRQNSHILTRTEREISFYTFDAHTQTHTYTHTHTHTHKCVCLFSVLLFISRSNFATNGNVYLVHPFQSWKRKVKKDDKNINLDSNFHDKIGDFSYWLFKQEERVAW